MTEPWAAKAYGLSWLGVGARVVVEGGLGVVTKLDTYAHVRSDGRRHPVPYHPRDVREAPPDAPAPPRHRHSSPERVTEHTRWSPRPVSCVRCSAPIAPGERYRQTVGVQTEWSDRDFHLARAHVACVANDPTWSCS